MLFFVVFFPLTCILFSIVILLFKFSHFPFTCMSLTFFVSHCLDLHASFGFKVLYFLFSLFHFPLTCIFFFLIILVLVHLLVSIYIGNFHGFLTPLLHYDCSYIVNVISQLLATIFLMIYIFFFCSCVLLCFFKFYFLFVVLLVCSMFVTTQTSIMVLVLHV